MPKTYADTYLFKKNDYGKQMAKFIMESDRLDVTSSEMEDVVYDFKRKAISDTLYKIFTSKNVVLMSNPKGSKSALPKAFKAFVAKDIKNNNAVKAFIDVTDLIVLKGSKYQCLNMEWLVAYTINAMVSYIYAKQEQRLVGNAAIITNGGIAFVRAFSYIIDLLYKTSTVQQLRQRIEYMSALYYQVNILGKDLHSSNVRATSVKMTDIEAKDAKVIDIMVGDHDFDNIENFVKALERLFGLNNITVSAVVSKWMFAFGTGNAFALEYFPAFSAMLTNAYVGGYIDKQANIEKIINPPATPYMTYFTKAILQIGASVV